MNTSVPVVLDVRELVSGYSAGVDIVKGLNAYVARGEIVTVVGPNGAGKSTLLKSVMGLTTHRSGEILLDGDPIHGRAPFDVAAHGVGYVPQRKNVFASMTVEENVEIALLNKAPDYRRTRVAAMYEMFPRLAERRTVRAGALSGGERQMVAMAKALAPEPKILLLDEPTAGLSPAMATFAFAMIKDVNAHGITIFMVEQNARKALKMSHRAYVLELGKDKLEGKAQSLLDDPQVGHLYLGGHHADGGSAG